MYLPILPLSILILVGLKQYDLPPRGYTLASTGENLIFVAGEQQRRRPACASAQPDQRQCRSLPEQYNLAEAATCTCEISIFQLVFVAQQARLKPYLSQILKTDFA